MTLFTELSPYFLIAFLQDWISVKEVCWLNSAFCNKKQRTKYDSIFAVKCFLVRNHSMSSVSSIFRLIRTSSLLTMRLTFDFICVRNMTSKNKWDTFYNFHHSGCLNSLSCFCCDATLSELHRGVVFTCVDEEWSYIYKQDTYRAVTVFSPAVEWMWDGITPGHAQNNPKAIEMNCASMPTKSYSEVCEFRNGDVYVGEWYADRQEGVGDMRWRDGRAYRGGWAKGTMSGQGTMTFSEEDNVTTERYTGAWRDGMKHGTGSMHYKCGDTYTGEWRRDMRYGKGKVIFTINKLGPPGVAARAHWVMSGRDQEVSFEGDFRNDLPDGTGVILYISGTRYEGEMRGGLRHGRGMLCDDRTGVTHNGTWVNGVEKSCMNSL